MYPPLEHAVTLLARAGWHIHVMGELAGTEEFTFTADTNINTTAIKRSRMPSGLVRHLQFLVRVLLQLARFRPEVIYVSDPLACPAAAIAARFSRGRIVYHEHDSPAPGELGDPLLPRTRRRILSSRNRVAERAIAIVLPNAMRADSFNDSVRRKVVVVKNCPLRDEVSETAPSDAGGLTVLYQGSLVPDRLPLTVVDALSDLPDHVALQIIGYETHGHSGYLRRLLDHAADLGLENRVHYAGSPQTRAELLELISRCDVGLALVPIREPNYNMHTMEGASNKPFDYLARGLALIVSAVPAWERMFVETGCAVSCVPEDRDSIAGAIRRLAEDPEERHRMVERGRARLKETWNYEAQFAPVLTVLES